MLADRIDGERTGNGAGDAARGRGRGDELLGKGFGEEVRLGVEDVIAPCGGGICRAKVAGLG
jgi:hypothetical protein